MLAGPAAQRKYNPRGVRSHHASGDIKAAIDLLGRIHSPEELRHVFRYLEARARNLVGCPPHWMVIQDLASQLLKRGKLTGDEIAETIRQSLRRR